MSLAENSPALADLLSLANAIFGFTQPPYEKRPDKCLSVEV